MRLGVAFLIYVALVLCASLALAAPAAKNNAALAAPNAAATPTEAERKPPASIFGVLAGHLRAYAPGRGQHATPPGAASPPDHERGAQQAAARAPGPVVHLDSADHTSAHEDPLKAFEVRQLAAIAAGTRDAHVAGQPPRFRADMERRK